MSDRPPDEGTAAGVAGLAYWAAWRLDPEPAEPPEPGVEAPQEIAGGGRRDPGAGE